MKLVPMTDADYKFWSERSREAYRDDKMKANGYTREEAQRIADESLRRLLPEGLRSKDNYLYAIRHEQGSVHGYVWFALQGSTQNREAFLYDIVIEEEFRGKGLGRETMKLLEIEVKRVGGKAIGLHVFGHNATAIHLYQSLGYRTTDLVMKKEIVSS